MCPYEEIRFKLPVFIHKDVTMYNVSIIKLMNNILCVPEFKELMNHIFSKIHYSYYSHKIYNFYFV